MGRYFKLQFKRLLKLFLFVFLAAVILLVGTVAAFKGIANASADSEENNIFQIGMCGDTESKYFQVGLTAMDTLDSSRYTIKLIKMDENIAKAKLNSGEISAYVIIPEGFVRAVARGDILPIKYVSTESNLGISSVFKNEITSAVSQLILSTQKGVFGLERALYNYGYGSIAYNTINRLNLEFIDMIVSRDDMYKVEELGIASGSNYLQYYVCSLAVVFLLLILLPYATVLIKKDYSLNKLLKAANISVFSQTLSGYMAYVSSVIILVALLFGITGFGAVTFFDAELQLSHMLWLFIKLLPVLVLAVSFSWLLNTLSSDIISGVLLQFFASLFLCYITGCFYPLFAFPVLIQKLSPFLPTGAARDYLAGCLNENNVVLPLVVMAVYTASFLIISNEAVKRKIGKTGKVK